MLEIGRVVHARRQHDDGRFGRRGWRRGTQSFEQQIGVMGDRCDAVFTEQLGKKPHHHLAVFQHVAHPARHPEVVFEHIVFASAGSVRCANNIDAADVRINVAGHIDAHHFGAELRVLEDLLGRHYAGLEDVLAVVHIMNKAVQRCDALYQPFFHAGPFVGGNDARDQVKGNQPFSAAVFRVWVFVLGTINRKSYAYAAEDHFSLIAPGLHGLRRLAGQPVAVTLVMLPHAVSGRVHFVKHRSHELYLRLLRDFFLAWLYVILSL